MKYHQDHNRATAGFLTLSGLLLGLVLADQYEPPAAIASDDKIFAPQSCLPRVTPDDDIGDARFLVTSVERTMEDDEAFYCPLVRDFVTGSLDAVWVRVNNADTHDVDPPSCCVDSYSPVGDDESFECQQGDNSKGRQTLEFALDDFDEFDHGYYVLSCSLELGDSIYSIRTRESD